LDWLATVKAPVTPDLFDSVFLPIIPFANERMAVITALQAHHLIDITGNVLPDNSKRNRICWLAWSAFRKEI
jgi:hypothetical protein